MAVPELAQMAIGAGLHPTQEQFDRYGRDVVPQPSPQRAETTERGLAAVDGLLADMDGLATQLRKDDDDRWQFLVVYRDTTRAIGDSLRRGRFLDVPWTTHLTLRFAGMYLDAHRDWDDRADTVPAVWRRAFERAADPGTSVLERVLQGMNAHINDDLPRAIAGMLRDFDLNDEALAGLAHDRDLHGVFARRHFDHEVVNDILAETVDHAQELVNAESSVLALADRIGFAFDEIVFESVIRHFRGRVWHQALALAYARDDTERQVVRREIQVLSMANADRIERIVDRTLGRVSRSARRVRSLLLLGG